MDAQTRATFAALLLCIAVACLPIMAAHRVFRGVYGPGVAMSKLGDVRTDPRISPAARKRARNLARPAPDDPVDDDDGYLAMLEGVGAGLRADIEQLVSATRADAADRLRETRNGRDDVDQSVNYMIEAALSDAAAAARSVLT